MTLSKPNGYPHTTLLFRYILMILFAFPLFAVSNIPVNTYSKELFYTIQLNSFKEVKPAEERVKELKKLGHNAFYRKETVEGKGDLYNVYIENYGSKEEAEKDAKVLKELNLISDYTVQMIEEKSENDAGDKRQGPKGYYMRVSSLKDKVNAEKTLERLKKSGYDVFFRRETVKGKGVWYRVYIQGYKSKGEAEKDAKRLRESGLISGYALKPVSEGAKASTHKKNDGKKVYFLHVSSFKEKINAEQEVNALKGHGLKSFLVAEDVSGKKLFRVYIGEFDSENAARKVGSELAGKGIITYFKPFEIDRTKIKD